MTATEPRFKHFATLAKETSRALSGFVPLYSRGARRVVTLEARRRVGIRVETVARTGASLEPRLTPFGGRETNARRRLVSFDQPR